MKIKDFLKGKKVYILSLIAVIGIWVDYFTGGVLGLSELCSMTPEGDVCTPDVAAAAKLTWAAVTASALRAGMSKVK